MSDTTVLHVGGLHWATSERAVETALLRRPGVESVEANAVNQSATVTYDPHRTSVAELAGWVQECGYHCAGRSVPNHVCDPMEEPPAHEVDAGHARHPAAHAPHAPVTEATDVSAAHAGHAPTHTGHAPAHTGHAPTHTGHAPAHTGHVPASEAGPAAPSAHDVMGHGGHGAMSMDDMVRDMRNRFLVALVLTAGIVLWSPM
ncbi:MAG TPA: heavy-metal-associated domain-containing protein, partial [Ornithinibacter sp.]|nr:heavy-metal-associated domain-containing protein [Ornithinibacter sp.]